MAIKRLYLEPYDASAEAWRERRTAKATEWGKMETRWRSLGIKPRDILLRLKMAGEARAAYETRLRASQQRTTEATLFTPEGQRVRRLLAAAKPFVEFMKTERDHRGKLVFGKLGKEVEAAMQVYRERYLLDQKGPESVRNPRHRPAEEWLPRYVHGLARIFHAKRLSRGRTAKAIYDALVLAGHADVVTLDKIHRLIDGIWPELQIRGKTKPSAQR